MRKLVHFILGAFLVASPSLANAAQLDAKTWQAWEQYLKAADSRMKSRLISGHHFMWIDDVPERRVKVSQGEILTAPVGEHGAQAVPDGLIHDWIGVEFIPNTTIEQFLDVIEDYGNYKAMYGPTVVDSQALGRDHGADRYSMELAHRMALVTTALDTQYQVQTFQVNENEYYAISQSTSVRQIRNYGKPDQEELPAGQGDGFIWSLHSIARYQQRDGGVYVELEAIALTRDIPGSLRWLVKPIVTRLSRNSLSTSLEQTRHAVCPGRDTETEATSAWRPVQMNGAQSGFQKVK